MRFPGIVRRTHPNEIWQKGLFLRGRETGRLNYEPPELAIVESVNTNSARLSVSLRNRGIRYDNVRWIFSNPNNRSLPEPGDVVLCFRDRADIPYAFGTVFPEMKMRTDEHFLPDWAPGDYSIATKRMQMLRMRKSGDIQLMDVLQNGFFLQPHDQSVFMTHRNTWLKSAAGILHLGEPRFAVVPGMPLLPVFNGVETLKRFLLHLKSNIGGIDLTKARIEIGNIMDETTGLITPSWVPGGTLVYRAMFPSDGVGGLGGPGLLALVVEADDLGNARLLLPETAIDGLTMEGLLSEWKTTFLNRTFVDLGSTTTQTGINRSDTIGGTYTLSAGLNATLQVGASTVNITPEGVTITGSGQTVTVNPSGVTIQAGSTVINCTAGSVTITSPTMTLTGAVNIAGNLAVSGGIMGAGMSTALGGVTLSNDGQTIALTPAGAAIQATSTVIASPAVNISGAVNVSGSLMVNGKPVLT